MTERAPAAATVWEPAAAPRAWAGHVPALDGVRGVAILLVLVHHQTIMGASTPVDRWFLRLTDLGWCGVDLFFVLSGFLITGILLDTKGTRHYFRNFYARRTLRIFPLYYAVAAFSLLILPQLPAWKDLFLSRPLPRDEQGLYYWLYLSNFLVAWRNAFEHPILGVTWSLAIEEQYYLVWAFVVWALRPATLLRVCAALVITALALRVALLAAGTSFVTVYVLPFTRMDALAVGGFIAAAVREGWVERLMRLARLVGPIAAIVVLALWARDVRNDRWEEPLMQMAGYSTLAVLFGALVVAVVTAPARTASMRLLSSRLLRSFGKYSYAIYLLHLPVQVFVERTLFMPPPVPPLGGSQIPAQLAFFAVATSACWIAGWVSWHLYEKHFLALKRHFG